MSETYNIGMRIAYPDTPEITQNYDKPQYPLYSMAQQRLDTLNKFFKIDYPNIHFFIEEEDPFSELDINKVTIFAPSEEPEYQRVTVNDLWGENSDNEDDGKPF